MEDINMEVKSANNGKECIKIFKKWQPDLIWMDRLMPVMNGIEATRRIRKLPDGGDVKIVAVTASAFKEQEDELLNAGMDGFVRKPYRINEIYDCMVQQLGLKLVYRETTVEKPAATLNINTLARMPEEVRKELEHALKSLDVGAIDTAIKHVADQDAELAKSLSRIVESLDYPAILNVLSEASGIKGNGRGQ
jgi:CheY-like chemotaxis protein